MLKINYLKLNKQIIGLNRNVSRKKTDTFINNLPFKLTIDQNKAVNDIYDDLVSKKRMNRLLQGDVGSGKTIVSFIALYINYLSGYQGSLMAPTEILANQHYLNMKNIFEKYNIKIALLTGKMKAKDKKQIYKELKDKEKDLKEAQKAFDNYPDPTFSRGIVSQKHTVNLFDTDDVEIINDITVWNGEDVYDENETVKKSLKDDE
jgi:superfamily II RNA helicase